MSTLSLCKLYIMAFAFIGCCGVSVEVHLSLALWVLVESSFLGRVGGVL